MHRNTEVKIPIDGLAPNLLTHARNRLEAATTSTVVECVIKAAMHAHHGIEQPDDGLAIGNIDRMPLLVSRRRKLLECSFGSSFSPACDHD
jgi:hypothetical protein